LTTKHRIALAGALLTLIPVAARADTAGIDPKFLPKIAAAVKAKNTDSLDALAAPDVKNNYQWLNQGPSLIASLKPWNVKLLELPGVSGTNESAYVAVTKYHPCESTSDHLYHVTVTPAGTRLGAEVLETDTGGYRVRDHKLTVKFDVPGRTVYITDRVLVERSSTSLPAAVLRINSIHKVYGAKRDGTAVSFSQAGGFLALPPPEKESATYDLAYKAAIGAGLEDYIEPNQAGLTSYWYTHTGRQPATSEVRITVPRGWAAIGQGEPLGKEVAEKTTTFSWKNTVPVSYLTVAAGKYTVTSRKAGDIAVSAYLLHHTPERAKRAIDTAAGALQWFSKNFSKFPYTRFAVVETDMFPAALECYSFTLAGRQFIPLAVVHEIAHTWWGGVVPNTYTRSLWNESFAEYSDGLYGRQTGSAGLHEFTPQLITIMAPLISKYSLLEARDSMDMPQSAVGYGKGSLVLENLERLLGTPKMLLAMQQFIRNHKPGEDAEWKDFIDAVTETAGKEWADFFPPWLSRTDLPQLKLADVKATKEGGKFIITGNVAQDGEPFWTRVPVMIQTPSGEVRVDVTAKTPATVSLDPRHETLRANPPTGTNDQTVVKLKL
jgi:hypothetical protein